MDNMPELMKIQGSDNKKLAKLKEDLLRTEFCIICAEETATRYKLYCPYLAKTILTELKNLNVCPVKLLQFLRMCFFQLQDGGYS